MVAGAEAVPPELVAVIESVITSAAAPVSRVGAVKDTVAELAPVEVTVRLRSAGAPVWLTVNVTGCAGMFGSVALTAKELEAVENTVNGPAAMGPTVGAAAAFTAMLVLAEAVPHAPVTDTVAVTGEVAPRAEKVVLETLAGATPPLETVHAKVNGPVPVAVAARATAPPAATVYGPPALDVGAVQAGVGMVAPGHGLSCPGITGTAAVLVDDG